MESRMYFPKPMASLGGLFRIYPVNVYDVNLEELLHFTAGKPLPPAPTLFPL